MVNLVIVLYINWQKALSDIHAIYPWKGEFIMKPTEVKKVESIEVTTIIDNYCDVLLTDSPGIKRPPLAAEGEIPADTLLAEHGLSLLIKVKREDENHSILFDCGWSRVGVPHNMRMMGLDPKHIEGIVLSHGHMDHNGALYPVSQSIGRTVPLVVHPDAFLNPRFLTTENGQKIYFPVTLARSEIKDNGLELMEKSDPSLIAGNMLVVTGEIPRVTDFEKVAPNGYIERHGKIEQDVILDDQAVILNLKKKGLVVITGCGHAGIINTVLYAKKLTGINRIYAVLGGFHLSGAFFEPVVDEVIKEFKKIDPQVIIPMHCTGWTTVHRFSREFPSAFALNSVGTRIELK